MQEVDGKTKVYGLIGNPVEHTLSPAIHNTLAALYGHNLVYVPFHVVKNLSSAIEGAYRLGIAGLNVTVPYKNDVLECCSYLDPLAEQIGAVNTLVGHQDGYHGYNTDMLGLFRSLSREKISLQGEDIILIGAGGAARAVAMMCAMKGARCIYILNRTIEKAIDLKEQINRFYPECLVTALSLSECEKLPDKKYLAIQCTSIGLSPDVESTAIEDTNFYQKIHTGYDLIYKPNETKFMKLVKENGGRAVNGLGMLVYQGIIAYELWNDITVSEEYVSVVRGKLEQEDK